MSAPVLARIDEATGGRFYTWKGRTYWSVTTLIGGGVPKFGLPPWYAKTTAELVVDDLRSRGRFAGVWPALRRWTKAGRDDVLARQAAGELRSIRLSKLDERDLALRWLKGAPVRIRDAAGEIGSDVHDEAELLVLRLALATAESYADNALERAPDWPDGLLGHMRAFKTFLAEWRPLYGATEATVFNPDESYAGTLDAIAELDKRDLVKAMLRSGGVPAWLDVAALPDVVSACIDYKAGREVHPEVGMQLAAYRRGSFLGLRDRVTEAPMPRTDLGLVLHLTPTGYALRPVRTDDVVFDAFRFARELYRWSSEIAPTILSAPLRAAA